jgi:hypothetical protein
MTSVHSGRSLFFLPDPLSEGGIAMKECDEITRKKGLPHVGQMVRNKKYGTIWRVMEKREIWRNIDPDPQTGEPRMVPCIYLRYWKVEEGNPPGVGNMLGYEYTLYDNTLNLNWDVLN